MHILAINPGSTSTKLALFENEQCLFECSIEHNPEEVAGFGHITEQVSWRCRLVEEALRDWGVTLSALSAVVGRGGRLRPVPSGTYTVTEAMMAEARACELGEHASNLGCLIAHDIAQEVGVPAYIVDPVSVDELRPEARVTGLPEVQRFSLGHALNIKAVARKAAATLGRSYDGCNLIVAHLGGGSTISAHYWGQMIDCVNSDMDGFFSTNRAGAPPSLELVRMCFREGATMKGVWSRISGSGGLVAHLRTGDAREIERRIHKGDAQAELVFRAMAYGTSKYIGAMAVALYGRVDAIVVTGGLAKSHMLMDWIEAKVRFLAPVLLYPGSYELEALALGALRVLRGEEQVNDFDRYPSIKYCLEATYGDLHLREADPASR